MARRTPRAKLVALIVCYYLASTLTSVLTKKILDMFARPITVSFVQQLFACAGGLVRLGSIRDALAEWRAALPVALTLLISLILYRISLVHNTLSFSQAVKTLQPLFATMLSAVLLRERSSWRRMLSLILLVVGVGIATKTEVNFSLLGFVCTVGSCFAQAAQQVLSKSLLVHDRIGEDHLFACAALFATLMLAPLWLATDARSLLAGEAPQLVDSGAAMLLLLNGFCNFVAQSLSFAMLCAVVSPVSAAVVSTFKRVVVIGAAVVWFRTPITPLHAFGIVLAACGVGLYEERHRTPETASPYVSSLQLSPSLAANPRRRSGKGGADGLLPPAYNGYAAVPEREISSPMMRTICRAV
jgi:solute carrier family 35, member E1